MPFPNELEYFVKAALTANADVVTAMARFFRNDAETSQDVQLKGMEYFPLGASLPISLFQNEYGDANALVRRKTFLEDGGFTEIYGVGFEDHEFFLKSESLGRKMIFIPEPIFNYRVASGSMLRSTSAYKGAKRARSSLQISNQRWVQELVDFAQDVQLQQSIKEQAWWRAGDRRFGHAHQQMMQGDPGSSENIDRFMDLAISYERIEDIVHMALRKNSLMTSLSWLENGAKILEQTSAKGRQFLKRRPLIRKFDTFANVELIAPTTDVPTDFSIVNVEESGVLVHPLTQRTTKARVNGALPAGTKRVSVPFSHRGDQGETVQVAIEIHCDGVSVADSGWYDVAPGNIVDAVIELPKGTAELADLILKTTVDGAQYYCWVFADHLWLQVED